MYIPSPKPHLSSEITPHDHENSSRVPKSSSIFDIITQRRRDAEDAESIFAMSEQGFQRSFTILSIPSIIIADPKFKIRPSFVFVYFIPLISFSFILNSPALRLCVSA